MVHDAHSKGTHSVVFLAKTLSVELVAHGIKFSSLPSLMGWSRYMGLR